MYSNVDKLSHTKYQRVSTRDTLVKIGAIPIKHDKNGSTPPIPTCVPFPVHTTTTPDIPLERKMPSTTPKPNLIEMSSSTSISAWLFLTCAVIFAFVGVLSAYTNNQNFGQRCIVIEREQHKVVAQILLGQSHRRLRVLVRMDTTIDCDTQPSLVITDQSSVSLSESASCENSLCTDLIAVRYKRFTEFAWIQYAYGVSGLSNSLSYSLGLDGELKMCRGFNYMIDEQQMCWEDQTDVTHSEESAIEFDQYHETLELQIQPNEGGDSSFMTTMCAVSQLSVLDTSNYCKSILEDTSACSSTLVNFIPYTSFTTSTFTGLKSDDLETSMKKTVQLMHVQAAISGRECDESEHWGTYTSICQGSNSLNSFYQCNVGTPMVAMMMISRLTLGFSFPLQSNVATVRLATNHALSTHSLPGDINTDDNWTNLAWPIIRLLIMILAAAVVYIRQEDSLESNDKMFIGCIRLVTMHQHQQKPKKASASGIDQSSVRRSASLSTTQKDTSSNKESKQDASASEKELLDLEDQSQLLGILAIMARAMVLTALGRPLWKSGVSRVVITQVVATSCSFIHWCITHSKTANNRRKLALGGSSAIIDVSSAILVAFSTPPIRADMGTFNTIARLLTAMLITITGPTRCFFSSACAGLIYGVESVVTASFWYIQAATIAVTVVDLFAVPAAIDMMRSSRGTWSSSSFIIFSILLSICGPRLTANAIAIHRESTKLKQYHSTHTDH